MKATAEDYQAALEDVLAVLRGGLGEDLVSVLLYGSMARREVKPGRSDLLDAYVYLADEVFDDKERFFRALETMVAACDGLARSGLPYKHPFQYWSRGESGHAPAVYLADWRSDERSRLVFGEDLRPQIRSPESALAVARLSFMQARRMGHDWACFLAQPELTAPDCQEIREGVQMLMKFLPTLACASLGIWTHAGRALPELLKALPGLDAASAAGLDAFVRDGATAAAGAEELREVLRRTLDFIEDLHDRIFARWGGHAESAGPPAD